MWNLPEKPHPGGEEFKNQISTLLGDRHLVMLHTPDLRGKTRNVILSIHWTGLWPHHSSAKVIPTDTVAGSVSDGGDGRAVCGNRGCCSVALAAHLLSAYKKAAVHRLGKECSPEPWRLLPQP